MPKLLNELSPDILGAANAEFSCGFQGRYLDFGDIDRILALHDLALKGVPADWVARETGGFFEDHVDKKGRILGIFAEAELIAYGVLGLPGDGDDNFGHDHGLVRNLLPRVAHLDGASVHPQFHGHNLHLLLSRWRMRLASSLGRTIILSTVSPNNHFSLLNLLACGLHIRGVQDKFGGVRYLMRSDVDCGREPGADGQWFVSDDLASQILWLNAGWWGWRAQGGATLSIYYAAPHG